MKRDDEMLRRFMEKVREDAGCWIWTGAKDRKGYGKFSIGNSRMADGKRRNSMVSAHRVSYELFIGPIPEGQGFHGSCVLHRCDNPACVNPAHLFIGSNADNVRDMDLKGRRITKTRLGSAHHNAVLDEQKVAEIYQMAIHRLKPQLQIARQFGVCLSTVSHIKTGRLWSHVTGART